MNVSLSKRLVSFDLAREIGLTLQLRRATSLDVRQRQSRTIADKVPSVVTITGPLSSDERARVDLWRRLQLTFAGQL